MCYWIFQEFPDQHINKRELGEEMGLLSQGPDIQDG